MVLLAGLGSLSTTSSRQGRTPATGADRPVRARRARAPGAGPLRGAGLTSAAGGVAADPRLAAVLAQSLALAGPQIGALVYDLGAQQTLFARRPGVMRPPASVEKLYTTVAALRVLGPAARLHTAVLGRGYQRGAVWHGDLYLRGGGDPTFGDAGFDRVWDRGQGATVQTLIAQIAGRGIRRVTGRVYGDESLFDARRGGLLTHYAMDTPDFGGQLSALAFNHGSALRRLGPARFAVKQFVSDLGAAGVTARAASRLSVTPSGAAPLASVSSPPLSAMTRLMDVPSDDLFAELFAKQLGALFGSGGTISGGAQVIRGTIAAAFGLHPVILDGSGLARDDRSSPAEIVDLLRDVWRTPVGRGLAASLPTVGVEGTVQYIGIKTAARGRCIAKTGTLDGVTNLAGYCRTRAGRDVAFALMVDGPSNAAAIPLESRMIGAIARY
ncbi:MAG: D-alanyl-D-alanine carboxypeptidase [Solirubrobacteraceae bacterium]